MIRRILPLLLLISTAAYADRAEVALAPTRIIMENGARFAQVNVINTGNAAGDYNVEIIDLKMSDAGDVMPYEAGETPQYSALSYLNAAPKSFTLGPGAVRQVRVLLKPDAAPRPGEYRAHLKIALKNDGGDVANDETMQVKTDVITTIPVILRVGKTTAQTSVVNVHMTEAGVAATITRQGDRSVIGNVTVFCDGKEAGTWRGLAIYRPNAQRTVTVPVKGTCAKPSATFAETTASSKSP